MTRYKSRALSLAAVMLFVLAPCFAQPRDSSALPSSVEEGLASLALSVQEMASLLREAVRKQEVSLLIARIDLKARSLVPLETELRGARASRAEAEEELGQIQARFAAMEEDARRDAAFDPSTAERMKREAEFATELMQRRMEVLDRRIVELENELARGRREIRSWEEAVDERLGLR